MMNNPFFRSRPTRQFQVQQTQRKSSPNIIPVPVRFVSSEQQSTTWLKVKESAAIKIQRAFRGHLVRKSVKQITSIHNEVREIERRIGDIKVAELIRRDPKERLRVNETLMSLLLKLDSVRGFDCGVRDLRKEVTKKAIVLQEKVDSIVDADHQALDSSHQDPTNSVLEQVQDNYDFHDEIVGGPDKISPDDSDSHDKIVDNSDSVAKVDEEGEVVKEIDENCNPVKGEDDFYAEKFVGTNLSKGFNEGKREVVEKLMEDNEKMMKLMVQILERNELQTRMLNSLSQRVEQLEKALRRKKKRTVA